MTAVEALGEPPRPFVIRMDMSPAETMRKSLDTLNAQMRYAADLIEAIRADHAAALRGDES